MKIILLTVLMSTFLLNCVPVQVAPTISMEKELLFSKDWNIAVMDLNYVFEDEGQASLTNYKSAGEDGGRVVANLLANELATIKNLKLIERGQIAKLLDEQVLQQSGIIDSKNAAEIGKITGADAVIIGELTDYLIWDGVAGFGSTVSFSIRMIDTQSSRVILNVAISRARPYVDSFANIQLTAKEIVESIQKRK